MIEKFFRAFQHSREHWVFWPFLLLILQVVLYNFLLSKNGYLAFLEKSKEKQMIQIQIEDLMAKKKELEKKLIHVENEDQVIKEFIRRLYYYDDKYIVVKFIDETAEKQPTEKNSMGLIFIQRVYILISTLVMIIFTIFFWRRHNLSAQNES